MKKSETPMERRKIPTSNDLRRYAWLSANVVSALQVLWISARAWTNLPVADTPRLVKITDTQGEILDECVGAKHNDGWIVTLHGGHAIRTKVQAHLESEGYVACDPFDIALFGEPDLHRLLVRAQGPLGVQSVLLAWNHEPDDVQCPPDVTASASYLFDPPRIQLWGPVNAGKSSLLNALTGKHLARVADEPGLTRDVLEGCFLFNGALFRVFDAPGEMADAQGIDAAAIDLARQWREQADLVIEIAPDVTTEMSGNPWRVRSHADASDQPGVSVNRPETITTLKQRLFDHFLSPFVNATPEQQRTAIRTLASRDGA